MTRTPKWLDDFWGFLRWPQIKRPVGSRSFGGTNFGEVQLSQSKVALTRGLCLPRSPHATVSFITISRPVIPSTTPHRNTTSQQRPGLPIRRVWRGLVLVEAQQVESAEHRQETRTPSHRRAVGRTLRPQVVLECLDPLAPRSPVRCSRATAHILFHRDWSPRPERCSPAHPANGSPPRLALAHAFAHDH